MSWWSFPLVALAGYAIGSLPTAGALGHLFGVDLRSEGSRNPGANNALRTSGPLLASLVLLVEAAKGYLAVWIAWAIGGSEHAVAAALGAMAGNVYNVWYRFDGGKGLAIALGVLLGIWPTVLIPVLAFLVLAVAATRSAGLGSLAALGALIGLSLDWEGTGWPTGGVEAGLPLVVFAVGATVLLAWKHWRDSPLNVSGRRRNRARV